MTGPELTELFGSLSHEEGEDLHQRLCKRFNLCPECNEKLTNNDHLPDCHVGMLAVMAAMPQEQREKLFQAIRGKWCIKCGDETNGKPCCLCDCKE